ncbi:extensin family protein [Amorphus orientalis]|uniref:Extensin-like C-terminal domain-containing protein n=1 Tax=Amorphus orientalis TaxID=649198 RepID=A0AAE3VQ65_9HYPH|nr:extensin family protein [Amorphus orientalis]MDQ0316072.1 hypothetical protein [Amorphus orientalis]
MTDLIRIDQFAGVGIYYDRVRPEDYGVRGVPIEPFIDREFAEETERFFARLFLECAAAGLGEVTAIFTGGVGRDPSVGGQSYHHQNRTFDLDALVFEDGRKWVADSFPDAPHFYLGIEAVLRKSFGTVLTYDYNRAHQDHIHFDNGEPPGFHTMSKSRVLFLQNSLFYLFDRTLGRDGVYGPETDAIAGSVLSELNLGPLSSSDTWTAFLEATTDRAMLRSANVLAA